MHSKTNRLFIFHLILSLICLIAGGLFFALYHGYIVIRTTRTNYQKPISPIEKRTINLYFHKHGKARKEQVSVLWYGNNTQKTISHVANRWLRLAEEEQLPYQAVSLQSVIATLSHEAYLSFDRSPFFKSISTVHKLQWIEDLLQTLRKAKTGIAALYFLSNHAPLDDTTLDFKIPWPLTGFAQQAKNKKISGSNSRSHKKRRMRTIILRLIDQKVEPLAQHIKKALELRKTVKVIISTKTYVNQYDAAHAMNLKGADYCATLHSYSSRIKKPHIDIYAYAHTPMDRWKQISPLSFIPWSKAHLLGLKETNTWCQSLEKLNMVTHWCPYKPLKGITIPGVSFECTWYKSIDINNYVDQIVECIKKAFES